MEWLECSNFLSGLEGNFMEYPLGKVRNGMRVFEVFGGVYGVCC